MKATMNSDQSSQLRKAAVLIATLDGPLAEQLLAEMPEQEARQVRQLAAELGEINPSEYRLVFDEFRQAASQPTVAPEPKVPPKFDGVELDADLLARLETVETIAPPAPTKRHSAWQALSEADADILVDMLSAEQPQTVAVVMAQLEPTQAAQLIGRLSPELQVELLRRMSQLDPADDQSLQIVESQLANWLQEQRRRRERLAAGQELVQRILLQTPASQRNVLLARLESRDPLLVENLCAQPAADLALSQAQQGRQQAPASPRKPHAESLDQTPREADPLEELESFDDQTLRAALGAVDRETALLALAGVSELVIRRIVRGLPRRQANQFRRQIRSVGPTSLRDMTDAQRQVVHRGRAAQLAMIGSV